MGFLFSNAMRPHLCAWIAFFCFGLLISAVKALNGVVPVSLVMAARSLLGLVCLIPFIMKQGGWQATVQTRYPRYQILRAFCGIFGLGLNFYALPHIALADAQGINQLYPIFLVVLAPFLLDEYAGWRQWLALGIGLSGALLIAQPHGNSALLPALCVMGSAIASAVGDLLARYMGRHDAPLTITVWLFGLLGLGSLAWFLGEWALGYNAGLFVLTGRQILLLISIGATGAVAQLLIVQGFKFLPAATMGVYASLGLVWAVLFGFAFFKETPTWWFAGGAVLILLAARLASYTRPARAPVTGPVLELPDPDPDRPAVDPV
jgi:drug/metabolite transporter (DMT)-like permease